MFCGTRDALFFCVCLVDTLNSSSCTCHPAFRDEDRSYTSDGLHEDGRGVHRLVSYLSWLADLQLTLTNVFFTDESLGPGCLPTLRPLVIAGGEGACKLRPGCLLGTGKEPSSLREKGVCVKLCELCVICIPESLLLESNRVDLLVFPKATTSVCWVPANSRVRIAWTSMPLPCPPACSAAGIWGSIKLCSFPSSAHLHGRNPLRLRVPGGAHKDYGHMNTNSCRRWHLKGLGAERLLMSRRSHRVCGFMDEQGGC
jgi:hypothetical protein